MTQGYAAIGDVHTNTVESVFSLFKRGIIGTWYRVSAKHLQAYRKNPFLFRDTLLKLLQAEHLKYKGLVAAWLVDSLLEGGLKVAQITR